MKPARLLGFLLVFLLSFFVLKGLAFAQTPVQPQQDLHNYTQNVMIEVTSSLTCMIAGIDPINPEQKCLGVANGKIGPVDSYGGAIGVMGNLIAMTFTRPAGTGDYFNYLAKNFGITKPVYAQQNGLGFQGLSPLIPIWTAFRNITYLLFVLIFVVIGFAIMLRIHIDPRTVMSIENQIPKLIIGLILTTFSFAIVGLLIDLMWVFIYLSINVFSTISPVSDTFRNFHGLNALQVANNINLSNNSGFLGIGKDGLLGITTSATEGVRQVIMDLFAGPGSIFELIREIPLLGGIITTTVGAPINTLVSIILFLIFSIAILFALFRLWFALIKAYVMILIVAVFSPFWILAGLVPGSRLTFENLLRELGSNLIAFPATIVMFLLGKTFIDVFAGPNSQGIFVPPLIGNPGNLNAIGAIIGFGIILLSSDVVKMMRKALKAPEFDFAAIFKAIGVGAGVPGRLVQGGLSVAFPAPYYDPSKGMVTKGGTLASFLRAFGFMR